MFQSPVLSWRQQSTTGCLPSRCVISLPQAPMCNKVINIVQVWDTSVMKAVFGKEEIIKNGYGY